MTPALTDLHRLYDAHLAADTAWTATPTFLHASRRRRHAAADAALDALTAHATSMGWLRSMGPVLAWCESLLAGDETENQTKGEAA